MDGCRRRTEPSSLFQPPTDEGCVRIYKKISLDRRTVSCSDGPGRSENEKESLREKVLGLNDRQCIEGCNGTKEATRCRINDKGGIAVGSPPSHLLHTEPGSSAPYSTSPISASSAVAATNTTRRCGAPPGKIGESIILNLSSERFPSQKISISFKIGDFEAIRVRRGMTARWAVEDEDEDEEGDSKQKQL